MADYEIREKTVWFDAEQRFAQLYFDAFRTRGIDFNEWNLDQLTASQQALADSLDVPVVVTANMVPHVPVPVLSPWLERFAARQARLTMRFRPAHVDEEERVYTRAALNERDFRNRGGRLGLRFVRVLGWGSNGLACEYYVSGTRQRRLNRRLVVKARFSGEVPKLDMQNERKKLKMLARTEHILSLVPMAGLFQDANLTAAEQAAVRELDSSTTTPKIMLLDFMQRGDLDKLIRKAHSTNVHLPRSVVWRLFECLIDGVTMMAYPRRDQTQDARLDEIGPEIQDDMPAPDLLDWMRTNNHGSRHRNVVHFDFDPQNIFLKDIGQPRHQTIPRVHIGDFGKAMHTKDFGEHGQHEDFEEMWNSRFRGKPAFYAPEQFGKQWDQVDWEPFSDGFIFDDDGNQKRTAVAGNYYEWTNIYWAALSIRCCMTLHNPEMPPMPLATAPPNNNNNGAAAAVGDIANRYTYASDLLDPNNPYLADYGQPLCALVADCLQHLPADRPPLRDLRAAIAAGVAADPMTAADDRLVADLLYGPAGPPPPPAPAQPPPAVVAGAGAVVSRRVLFRNVPVERLRYWGRGERVELVNGGLFRM